MNKHTSLFENGLIWFGAAISVAEIQTGISFAQLGFKTGLRAIFTGHLIGCILLFLCGIVGGQRRQSAMETVKLSFGETGGIFFAVMNILQLVGWTAVMIYDGALAADAVSSVGSQFWCLVLGGLILLWIFVGITQLKKLNIFVMSALFVLVLILCKVVFLGNNVNSAADETLSFGAAVELSVAMPLSWLPLISDYTREAENPAKASAVSTVTYGITSCFMYIIGMGAAAFTEKNDIASILVFSGLGISGLLIVILSTVTTTFMDAYSAGISAETLSSKINGKYASAAATILGTIFAISFPPDNISGFLYFIGSVFTPMAAVLIADCFLLHRTADEKFDLKNFAIWIAGFALYRFLMHTNIPFGYTLPSVFVMILICLITDKCGAILRSRH